jgi:hypothetical protein
LYLLFPTRAEGGGGGLLARSGFGFGRHFDSR